MNESFQGVQADRSPGWAYGVCLGLVAIAFAMFGFTLDRYPTFYTDEPLFSHSAVRTVDGKSFVYPLHTLAPHKDEVWAIHGPFFSRLQVFTFQCLGVSHYAGRIPSYLMAHLAILALCFFLLKRGLTFTAIAVAAVWIGDRSHLEIILGRPEGICLFLLAVAFMFLVRALDSGSTNGVGVATCLVGLASGFNPACVYFVFGLAGVVALMPSRTWGRAAMAAVLGGLLPLGLLLWCWMPDLKASLEQFMWFARFSVGPAVAGKLEHVRDTWVMLRWSKGWMAGMVCVTIFFCVLVIWHVFARKKDAARVDVWPSVATVGMLFSLAGLAAYSQSSMYFYYFVLITVWPVLAFGTILERIRRPAGVSRMVRAAGLVWIVLWLPSLFWNATRCREAWVCFRDLDKQEMVTSLRRCVPPGCRVTGDPALFLVAHAAGLDFEPLPFFDHDPGMNAPPSDWLLLTPRFEKAFNRIRPSALSGRTVVCRETAFNRTRYLKYDYSLHGPQETP